MANNYKTLTCEISLSYDGFADLKHLSHIAKNLRNQAIYATRKHYADTGKYLGYLGLYDQLKSSENFKVLNVSVAQQVLRKVDAEYQGYFKALKAHKAGKCNNLPKRPGYSPKDGFYSLPTAFPTVRKKDGLFKLPFSKQFGKTHEAIYFKVPEKIRHEKIKYIIITPRNRARFFIVQYVYEDRETPKSPNPTSSQILAIDLGVNNLAACATTFGDSFLLDGKLLKSINQYYNKQRAYYVSIKDHQNIYGDTSRLAQITRKRNNQVKDIIYKAAKYIVTYCLENNIRKIVVGWSAGFKISPNMGKINNQNFTCIPLGKLLTRLEYLCWKNGIEFEKVEESYTSKSSFYDNDILPVYDKDSTVSYTFSGRRVHRGLYKTRDGRLLNADVNAALNMFRKSKVEQSIIDTLQHNRVNGNSPKRIRILERKSSF